MVTLGSKRRSTSPSYCEIPTCDWSLIVQRHRITPGREGGKYVKGNVISLCPSHHMLADRDVFSRDLLRNLIQPRLDADEIEPTAMDLARDAQRQEYRAWRDWTALRIAGLVEGKPRPHE